jgi:hypothetical protein
MAIQFTQLTIEENSHSEAKKMMEADNEIYK